ncbi:hypothetical protein N7474_004984 [Penicillium riverlandense]|uniref:uncharacterized protein n=1 Tax=Penicillium riverlandense TaxID=1903569 RepID=UPI0025467237|nr:uncharacterized protein N7474_010126 [Penicillium riverlandense]XP_057053795.1 uncharacterized protein N7474_004984 [Penicillium riverlandense]KAJ5808857.1 hypothetical protein N7474_010126 [Penicillium riverlandense]KAJ5819393.1 hypothetical protein N7474_004984 [Penicillium riverlandense]
MRPITYVSSVCLLTRLAVGNSFAVINNQGVCRIWSEGNHGCTGYSEPFAKFDGKDCSSESLRFYINGTSTDATVLKLDICGTENGGQAAWVTVDKNSSVSFINQQGETSKCVLDNDFKVGSKCKDDNTGSSGSSCSTTSLRQHPAQNTNTCACN